MNTISTTKLDAAMPSWSPVNLVLSHSAWRTTATAYVSRNASTVRTRRRLERMRHNMATVTPGQQNYDPRQPAQPGVGLVSVLKAV